MSDLQPHGMNSQHLPTLGPAAAVGFTRGDRDLPRRVPLAGAALFFVIRLVGAHL